MPECVSCHGEGGYWWPQIPTKSERINGFSTRWVTCWRCHGSGSSSRNVARPANRAYVAPTADVSANVADMLRTCDGPVPHRNQEHAS